MAEEPKLKPNTPVGQQLKSRRTALRISLAQVELDTKVRGKFLTALESGDYTSLPNDIYSRNFVQHYAAYLGLDGPAVAAAYAAERGGVTAGVTRRPRLERPKRLVVTGRVAVLALVALGVFAVGTYLVWQFSALAAAPRLGLTSPAVDAAITGSVIDVAGTTTPGADVSVNDSPVLSDANGNFSEKVSLQDGVNTIRVMAKSKLGKMTVLTRNVLARMPKTGTGTEVAVPGATFDGVAVAITVRETTSIVVAVDGQEAFRGTFVAGKSQLFTGKTDINITTGNAGVTSVVVTNAVAAGKKLSPLGREGEIRRNQDFAKTTVIP